MAILGAIVGDILGSQYEFDKPKDLDYKNCNLISKKGVGYTDDTVMTIAIMDAYKNKKDLVSTMQKWGKKYQYCGFGSMFFSWVKSENPKPYNSWGNGSAMRVSFVGEFFEDYKQMQSEAAKTASVSHNHPEGIKGAIVTATCIWMAKHNKTKDEIYNYVLQEYPSNKYKFSIDHDMEFLRSNYEWTEKCCDTVPAAMRCFYESTSYESFIRNIFSLDCDSDTFGAIAGGVAEEFYHGFGKVKYKNILYNYLPADIYELIEEYIEV